MNCLKARRMISTDIKDISPSLAQHLNECSSCKSFYDRQLAFNKKLKEALEVEVPEGLAARILVEQKLSQKKARSTTNRWVAMAASVMLVISVSVVTSLHSTPALAEAIVDHIYEDIKMLQMDADIPNSELNRLLQPYGVAITADIGNARSAGNCLIDGKLGAHIVFDGKNDPVTLIVVPQKITGDNIEFKEKEFTGMLVNTPRGTLALVSTDKESLMIFERQIQTNLLASL